MKSNRRFKVISFLIVIVGLCVWISSRWNAWFHNPPESAYTTSTIPSRILLTFGNGGESTRMVSWICGEKVYSDACLMLADSTDTLSIKPQGEVFESRAGKSAYYRAEIGSLKPNHTYSYAVNTNGTQSSWFSFKTSNLDSKSFSFLFMGDVQDTLNGISNTLLKKAIYSHPEVEFVAFGGDLIERPTDAYYNETFRSIDSVCTSMPIVNITGNHDYLKGVNRKCERRFALTFPYFLEGMDKRDDENHLFTFRYHNTQFFLLDSDRAFNYLFQQKSWLNEVMDTCKAEHKIVMLHQPLYSVKKKNNNIVQRWMFNDVIIDNGVDLVLQGHEHAYTHCTSSESPLQSHECTNPPLYTISHCSPKTYKINPTERFSPVLSGSRYYQVINVKDSIIDMCAYDAISGALVDSVSIKHNN